MLLGAHHDATLAVVRTTVTLSDDVAAEVERLRREQRLGLSEAVNQLVRRGMSAPTPAPRFRQRVSDMGPPAVPLDKVADVLDLLEGVHHT